MTVGSFVADSNDRRVRPRPMYLSHNPRRLRIGPPKPAVGALGLVQAQPGLGHQACHLRANLGPRVAVPDLLNDEFWGFYFFNSDFRWLLGVDLVGFMLSCWINAQIHGLYLIVAGLCLYLMMAGLCLYLMMADLCLYFVLQHL